MPSLGLRDWNGRGLTAASVPVRPFSYSKIPKTSASLPQINLGFVLRARFGEDAV